MLGEEPSSDLAGSHRHPTAGAEAYGLLEDVAGRRVRTACRAHHTRHPIQARSVLLSLEIRVDPRRTVRPVALLVELLDLLQQHCVRPRSLRRPSLAPRVVPAGGNFQHATHHAHRVQRPVIAHELVPPDGIEPVSRASQAAAFAKISRSIFTWRTSRRSRPPGQ